MGSAVPMVTSTSSSASASSSASTGSQMSVSGGSQQSGMTAPLMGPSPATARVIGGLSAQVGAYVRAESSSPPTHMDASFKPQLGGIGNTPSIPRPSLQPM